MAEILGLGMTHYPGMTMQGNLASRVKNFMKDPLLPEQYRDPATWPEPMRREWAQDDGVAASDRHRAALIENFRWVRSELDAFNPDLVLVWGDDQYENFREDVVPAFSVLAYDRFEAKPWEHRRGLNSWNEPPETEFRYKGHQSAGKYLASRLLRDGFEPAYAYQPLHDGMAHAFLNTALYLDWDRKGLPYPILPFAINCYGSGLIKLRGGVLNNLADIPEGEDIDPPSPQPYRCFDIGAAIARAMAASPWRVALVASSSWSHSFLTSRYSYFHPDVETDKRCYEAMKAGDYAYWRERSAEDVEASGHHELLNWFCLVGAMAELGRKPQESHFVESWLCNSDKVFAVFRP
ncbi:MAG TPA: extradiol ring-cleavage dioxygenase [Dehalococcoidia bacterium]|nr:extradiol ring-cleavage dioxygenase [Dehalococcoidia bacterium]